MEGDTLVDGMNGVAVAQALGDPVEAEDQRHLHRDLETLKQERASTTTRIKSLLSSHGIQVTTLTKLPEQLDALRLWDSSSIPPGLRRRVLRVYAHHTFLSQQIAEVEAERRAQLQTSSAKSFQPDSALSVWFRECFDGGGKRLRRVGIVAMARKSLIALWCFLETGVLPEGAVLKAG